MKGWELLYMIYSCKILGFTIITLWFPITKHLRILCVDKNMCVSNRSEQNTVKVEKEIFNMKCILKCSDFLPNSPNHDQNKTYFGKCFWKHYCKRINKNSLFLRLEYEAFGLHLQPNKKGNYKYKYDWNK